jgi:hypothetical protein
VSQTSLVGTPDILCCVNGRFVALELKKDSKSKASKLQEYNLLKVVEANGIAWVVHPENWEEVKTFLGGIAHG